MAVVWVAAVSAGAVETRVTGCVSTSGGSDPAAEAAATIAAAPRKNTTTIETRNHVNNRPEIIRTSAFGCVFSNQNTTMSVERVIGEGYTANSRGRDMVAQGTEAPTR